MGAWYRDWYKTTAEGEREMLMAFSDPDKGIENERDVRRRLAEMENVLDKGRMCSITGDQVTFLRRVLGGRDAQGQ